MPSVFMGRPIHHYAGQDDETLRAMGLEEADMAEVRHRLRDNEYDEERALEDAQNPDHAVATGREWVDDPLRPIPGAPEVYVTSTIHGIKSVPEQLEEARFNGEFERREALAAEIDAAEKQGEADRAHVEQRNAEAEVRAVEQDIERSERKLEAVREKASAVRDDRHGVDEVPPAPRATPKRAKSESTDKDLGIAPVSPVASEVKVENRE